MPLSPSRTSTIFGYEIFCNLCKFCYFSDVRMHKICYSFWGLCPQTPYWSSAPGLRWETSVPRLPDLALFHKILNTPVIWKVGYIQNVHLFVWLTLSAVIDIDNLIEMSIKCCSDISRVLPAASEVYRCLPGSLEMQLGWSCKFCNSPISIYRPTCWI